MRHRSYRRMRPFSSPEKACCCAEIDVRLEGGGKLLFPVLQPGVQRGSEPDVVLTPKMVFLCDIVQHDLFEYA